MPLVWDIFHASMNVEGGQLTWCCITGEFGKGSELFVPEEEFNEDFFFLFEKFGNLEFLFFDFFFFFKGIENFDWWIFFEKFGNLEFFQVIENFDWCFFLFF